MEKRPFTELGLSPEILKAVNKMGFEEASPIQTAVIPTILAGKDVVGQSSTGSGKTVAFAIPAVEKVDPSLRAVQVLILCPTRELAVQVAEEVAKVAFFKRGVNAAPIFGGQSYDRQFRALAGGAQIVIGTPGRIMDHMERGTLKLDSLKFVILDEADRMLDMGFRDDIEHVLSKTPAEKQALFFSATMPTLIKDLIRRFSRDPQWIKIEAKAENAPQVDQVYIEVDRRSKVEALTRLIDLHDFRYGIIFCSTKIMVDELDEHLHARGYAVDRLHGDITQAQRNRTLEKFRRRAFDFLIATDVAARGIDVDDLEVVFNFDLPNDAEDYTHRIGRTGRAGKTGKAITFVSGRELYKLSSMVRYGKLKIRADRIPSLDQVEEARDNVFFEKLRTTLDEKKFKPQDRMIDRLLDQGHVSTDICSALIHLLRAETQPPAEEAPPPAPARFEQAPPAWGKDKRGPGAGYGAGPGSAGPGPAPAPRPFMRSFGPEGEEAPPGAPRGRRTFDGPPAGAPGRPAFDGPPRDARTGRDPAFVTVRFNVGRQHLVQTGDLVGKIAGVTRLPASVVGAIDLHLEHSDVDITQADAELVMAKLDGVRLKGQTLRPALVGGAHGRG